jgi:hypothetical protein
MNATPCAARPCTLTLDTGVRSTVPMAEMTMTSSDPRTTRAVTIGPLLSVIFWAITPLTPRLVIEN